MRVMKFGGTSLESATRLDTVVGLIQEASAEGPAAAVTSAVAGVTDLLTDLVESKGPPTQESLESLVNFLWTRHLDLHPSDSGEVQKFHAGLEEILDTDAVTMIEWGERFPGLWPADHVEIELRRAGDEEREIEVRGL